MAGTVAGGAKRTAKTITLKPGQFVRLSREGPDGVLEHLVDIPLISADRGRATISVIAPPAVKISDAMEAVP